jgi:hypothetical protein
MCDTHTLKLTVVTTIVNLILRSQFHRCHALLLLNLNNTGAFVNIQSVCDTLAHTHTPHRITSHHITVGKLISSLMIVVYRQQWLGSMFNEWCITQVVMHRSANPSSASQQHHVVGVVSTVMIHCSLYVLIRLVVAIAIAN